MEPTARDAVPPGSVIVFYDGVCGFCNGVVRWLAERDRADRFRFAPLQGPLARELLLAHDANPDQLDTMYILVDYGLPDERVFSRARGLLRVCRELGPPWSALAILAILPAPLLDLGYRLLAGNRYRIFGKYDQCPIPPPRLRRKFVE